MRWRSFCSGIAPTAARSSTAFVLATGYAFMLMRRCSAWCWSETIRSMACAGPEASRLTLATRLIFVCSLIAPPWKCLLTRVRRASAAVYILMPTAASWRYLPGREEHRLFMAGRGSWSKSINELNKAP